MTAAALRQHQGEARARRQGRAHGCDEAARLHGERRPVQSGRSLYRGHVAAARLSCVFHGKVFSDPELIAHDVKNDRLVEKNSKSSARRAGGHLRLLRGGKRCKFGRKCSDRHCAAGDRPPTPPTPSTRTGVEGAAGGRGRGRGRGGRGRARGRADTDLKKFYDASLRSRSSRSCVLGNPGDSWERFGARGAGEARLHGPKRTVRGAPASMRTVHRMIPMPPPSRA